MCGGAVGEGVRWGCGEEKGCVMCVWGGGRQWRFVSQDQLAQLTSIAGGRSGHVADAPVGLEPLTPQHAFQQQGCCHQLLQSCFRESLPMGMGGWVSLGKGDRGRVGGHGGGGGGRGVCNAKVSAIRLCTHAQAHNRVVSAANQVCDWLVMFALSSG